MATYIPNYWNPAGPGDYNIPAYSETANFRNSPGYSMGPRSKMPYFPGFEIVSNVIIAEQESGILRQSNSRQWGLQARP